MDDRKLEVARKAGATHFIHTGRDDLHNQLAELTFGNGPDVVITRSTGSLALGYILPAAGYVVVALYALFVPRRIVVTTGRHSVRDAPQNT